VQTVQIDTDWVNRLYALLDILRRIVWLTAGLLGVGVILVVGNTIRLDILNRRAEIEVMKLVGAPMASLAGRSFIALSGTGLEGGSWRGAGGFGRRIDVRADRSPASIYGKPVSLRGLRSLRAWRCWGVRSPQLAGFLGSRRPGISAGSSPRNCGASD